MSIAAGLVRPPPPPARRGPPPPLRAPPRPPRPPPRRGRPPHHPTRTPRPRAAAARPRRPPNRLRRSPSVRRVHVVPLFLLLLPVALALAQPSPVVRLDVPGVRRPSERSGPASLAMVIGFYGADSSVQKR